MDTSWSIPHVSMGLSPTQSTRKRRAGRKGGREDVGSHASFESSHGAARPLSHPETQNPPVEESGRALLLR